MGFGWAWPLGSLFRLGVQDWAEFESELSVFDGLRDQL